MSDDVERIREVHGDRAARTYSGIVDIKQLHFSDVLRQAGKEGE